MTGELQRWVDLERRLRILVENRAAGEGTEEWALWKIARRNVAAIMEAERNTPSDLH